MNPLTVDHVLGFAAGWLLCGLLATVRIAAIERRSRPKPSTPLDPDRWIERELQVQRSEVAWRQVWNTFPRNSGVQGMASRPTKPPPPSGKGRPAIRYWTKNGPVEDPGGSPPPTTDTPMKGLPCNASSASSTRKISSAWPPPQP